MGFTPDIPEGVCAECDKEFEVPEESPDYLNYLGLDRLAPYICPSCLEEEEESIPSEMTVREAAEMLLGYTDGDIYYDASDYADVGPALQIAQLHLVRQRLDEALKREV